ncbi:RtcB family protein [Waddlia chondrophila]|uniref:tRNA-splicing ligase RtcB n=1 Tax=Waddlia chondrophila (strain ATCC VR-1470 / WSU 86-1044) TaxID=716544 RepID=D6YUX0_WADCW|nr:RtcB family protein [Waddlia chondrophila]ADI37931.1 conserved hypothetical protein [Waddlia chondrophila WSU 86-1044]
MFNLKLIDSGCYELPIEEGMRVPGLVIATDRLLQDAALDQPLQQVRNVAHLPGIIGYSIAMPDIHWGYGFPIGGVAAMDLEEGVISPGGVGYDINCGVRLAVVPLPFQTLKAKEKDALLQAIFKRVPSGVGRGTKQGKELTESDYKQIVEKGSRWSVEQGFGLPQDLEHTESRGFIEGGEIDAVSPLAKERGRHQLGSVGSGNHFVEIGEVSHLYLEEIAQTWGIVKGMTYILIHSGSRGFGHQICQDTLNTFVKKNLDEGLPDKQLIAAPIRSALGKQYFQAMASAANFAFNNRQRILHQVRQSFLEVLGTSAESIRLIYDVCHNIAKFEQYTIDGKLKTVCVHRKGATRAFGPGAEELAPVFQTTGQPVLVPGDMGRASHLMAGQGNPLTWCSSCHGAGRARSRIKSLQAWKGRDPVEYMENQGVKVAARSYRTIAEEMPDAYKDVDAVVEAVQEAGLARMVAKLRPQLVLKG